MKSHVVVLTALLKLSVCIDFYLGNFKRNDFLVAQDTVFKERSHFGLTTAKYGRVFHCPITYLRVVDRLGLGRTPRVKINRGGLQKKYVTLILTAAYRSPIDVNIYVGCANTLNLAKNDTTMCPYAGNVSTTVNDTDTASNTTTPAADNNNTDSGDAASPDADNAASPDPEAPDADAEAPDADAEAPDADAEAPDANAEPADADADAVTDANPDE